MPANGDCTPKCPNGAPMPASGHCDDTKCPNGKPMPASGKCDDGKCPNGSTMPASGKCDDGKCPNGSTMPASGNCDTNPPCDSGNSSNPCGPSTPSCVASAANNRCGGGTVAGETLGRPVEVLGVSLTRSDPAAVAAAGLARTGSELLGFAKSGMAVIVLGLGMLLVARRRRSDAIDIGTRMTGF
jgi:hypothetical protein